MLEVEVNPVVVTIALGCRWVALRAEHVREVLGRAQIVAVPGGPSGLVGVLAWRGRAVAVLDLGPTVGDEPLTEARARTLVVQTGSDTIALPVDRVREARNAESVRAAHAARSAFAAREVEVGGQLMPLFEPEQWLKVLERAPA